MVERRNQERVAQWPREGRRACTREKDRWGQGQGEREKAERKDIALSRQSKIRKKQQQKGRAW